MILIGMNRRIGVDGNILRQGIPLSMPGTQHVRPATTMNKTKSESAVATWKESTTKKPNQVQSMFKRKSASVPKQDFVAEKHSIETNEEQDVDMDEAKSEKQPDCNKMATRGVRKRRVITESEDEDMELAEHLFAGDEQEPTPMPQGMDKPESTVSHDDMQTTNAKKKKKVTKKVTEKNERGYMVTKTVQVWESCSDEEAVEDKKKEASKRPALVQSASTGKKSTAATSTRPITSFFKKAG